MNLPRGTVALLDWDQQTMMPTGGTGPTNRPDVLIVTPVANDARQSTIEKVACCVCNRRQNDFEPN
jgi:Zn-dependent M32 family carboxypeptidase